MLINTELALLSSRARDGYGADLAAFVSLGLGETVLGAFALPEEGEATAVVLTELEALPPLMDL